jgi:tetratricopeptide (TPR) repeat protein
MKLESGGVLVEFLPRKNRSLRLTAPGYTLRVVGTVFYASAAENSPEGEPASDATEDRAAPVRAGVLAGRVEVTPTRRSDAERDAEIAPIALEAGRELDARFETRELSAPLRRAADRRVNLEAHRRTLRALDAKTSSEKTSSEKTKETEAAEAPSPSPPSTASESGPPREASPDRRGNDPGPAEPAADTSDVQTLRARADRAAAAGRIQDALRYYNTVLERLPSDDATAGAVHLDIANLYLRKLDAPKRALPHLRIFLDRWPDDVAAPSVRREFCRVARQLDRREPRCSQGTGAEK